MRVAFIGSKRLGLRVLDAMRGKVAPPHEIAQVVTLDDRDDGRSVFAEFERYARRHDVPLKTSVAEVEADVGVVCGWYHRIDLPAVELFGFHASPLPRYRGQAPIPWQIINGESTIGLTMFKLTPGLDEGPIVAQDHVPLSPDQTVADALGAVEAVAVAMVREHLEGILDGTVRLQAQDESLATYCGPRHPADALIDWSQPAQRVHDFVRAQTRPYSGAFTTAPSGQRLTVWRTRVEPRPWLSVPGMVCLREGREVVVGCGTGAVRVMEPIIDLPVGVRLGPSSPTVQEARGG